MSARKFNTKANARNATVLKQVTSLRNTKQMSWKAIGQKLDIAPRTARRIFQEANGTGSHHGLLPGKGGRRPVQVVEEVAAA